jgi:hypothetical protein
MLALHNSACLRAVGQTYRQLVAVCGQILGARAQADAILEQLELLRRVRCSGVMDTERLEACGGQLGHLLNHATPVR